jgi:acyl carrier protein
MNDIKAKNLSTERTLRERLIALVRTILGPAGASRPLPTDARLSDLGMTSIKMVNLMLSIEMEFDLTIPQAEITPENFESIATMEALVLKVRSL